MADMQKIIERWNKNHDSTKTVIKDIKQLDTLADGQPLTREGENPNVGSTVVAGVVRELPRQTIKDLPTFGVAINGTKLTVESLACKFVLKDVVFNEDTFGKGIINTLQLGVKAAITRGFAPFQVATRKIYGDFGTTLKLLHPNDVAIEQGVSDAAFSGESFVRSRWSPAKLQRLYDTESKKENTSWNLKAVKALLDRGPDGSGYGDNSQYLTDAKLAAIDPNNEEFDMITRYTNVIGDDIIVFNPQINEPLRTLKSRSKFGFQRLLFLVIDPSESSAYGDSRVRLASPNQNFLNALRQNVATTWLYNSKPAMVQTGPFVGATELKNGAKLVSRDPNADIKLLTLDPTSAQRYVEISNEITDQILTMMGVGTPASLGAIGQAKTGVGAQAQQRTLNDTQMQITNICENFIRQYATVALDTYISEQDGTQQVFVDDDTKAEIEKVAPGSFNDPENPNALNITWGDLYDYIKKIRISIDTSIGKQELDTQKRGDLQDLLTVDAQTANPNDPQAQAEIKALRNELLRKIDPEIAASIPTPQEAPQPPANDLTPQPQV